jgi:probable phosphoglycerate mutase
LISCEYWRKRRFVVPKGTEFLLLRFVAGTVCGAAATEGFLTALILLIRHAAHAHLGNVLSGRIPGIALSPEGRSQADRLALSLDGIEIHAVQCSPVQRAQETALAIAARRRGLFVETVPALEEVDFGDWTGRSFAELADDPRWGNWNSLRETAKAPNGESMAQALDRAWDHIKRAAAKWPNQTIAMITHCDIIRAVIAKVLGLSLNHIHRFDVDPASISRLVVGAWGAKVAGLNETCP